MPCARLPVLLHCLVIMCVCLCVLAAAAAVGAEAQRVEIEGVPAFTTQVVADPPPPPPVVPSPLGTTVSAAVSGDPFDALALECMSQGQNPTSSSLTSSVGGVAGVACVAVVAGDMRWGQGGLDTIPANAVLAGLQVGLQAWTDHRSGSQWTAVPAQAPLCQITDVQWAVRDASSSSSAQTTSTSTSTSSGGGPAPIGTGITATGDARYTAADCELPYFSLRATSSPSQPARLELGGEGDMWGITSGVTGADLADGRFGPTITTWCPYVANVNNTAYAVLDAIRVRIWYDVPSSASPEDPPAARATSDDDDGELEETTLVIILVVLGVFCLLLVGIFAFFAVLYIRKRDAEEEERVAAVLAAQQQQQLDSAPGTPPAAERASASRSSRDRRRRGQGRRARGGDGEQSGRSGDGGRERRRRDRAQGSDGRRRRRDRRRRGHREDGASEGDNDDGAADSNGEDGSFSDLSQPGSDAGDGGDAGSPALARSGASASTATTATTAAYGVVVQNPRKKRKEREGGHAKGGEEEEEEEEEDVLSTTPSSPAESVATMSTSTADVAKELEGWTIDYDELEVSEQLARGNFGVVFRALYRENECVVKQLQVSGSGNDAAEEARVELLAEARMLARVRPHASIAAFFGVCLDEAKPLGLVVEFIGGGNLHAVLSSPGGGPEGVLVTEEDVLSMARDLASGLAHLHACSPRILHCDVAARNCLLVSSQRPLRLKLCDFGLSHVLRVGSSRVVDESGRPVGKVGGGYDAPSALEAGSPGSAGTRTLPPDDETSFSTSGLVFACRWIGPEVWTQLRYHDATDVWSVAVVIWEMLNRGTVPFSHVRSNRNVVKMVAQGARLPLLPTLPGMRVADALFDLMADCWCPLPEDRPTCDQVARRLRSMSERLASMPRDAPVAFVPGSEPVVHQIGSLWSRNSSSSSSGSSSATSSRVGAGRGPNTSAATSRASSAFTAASSAHDDGKRRAKSKQSKKAAAASRAAGDDARTAADETYALSGSGTDGDLDSGDDAAAGGERTAPGAHRGGSKLGSSGFLGSQQAAAESGYAAVPGAGAAASAGAGGDAEGLYAELVIGARTTNTCYARVKNVYDCVPARPKPRPVVETARPTLAKKKKKKKKKDAKRSSRRRDGATKGAKSAKGGSQSRGRRKKRRHSRSSSAEVEEFSSSSSSASSSSSSSSSSSEALTDATTDDSTEDATASGSDAASSSSGHYEPAESATGSSGSDSDSDASTTTATTTTTTTTTTSTSDRSASMTRSPRGYQSSSASASSLSSGSGSDDSSLGSAAGGGSEGVYQTSLGGLG